MITKHDFIEVGGEFGLHPSICEQIFDQLQLRQGNMESITVDTVDDNLQQLTTVEMGEQVSIKIKEAKV